MPRVFARDQCKTPKHCCEITICCGRGKQSVSKKLGNPVTGRKNFSVDEAKSFGKIFQESILNLTLVADLSSECSHL